MIRSIASDLGTETELDIVTGIGQKTGWWIGDVIRSGVTMYIQRGGTCRFMAIKTGIIIIETTLIVHDSYNYITCSIPLKRRVESDNGKAVRSITGVRTVVNQGQFTTRNPI